MLKPSYLSLLKNQELLTRVNLLKEMLKDCVLCPHQCKVNRLSGERGYCRTLDNVVVSGAESHFGEERELVGRYGSGTIFFSHCNLKCVFCQNYEISHCGEGKEMTPSQLADLMLYLQNRQCHNINLVSPGHIIPQIVEAIYIAAKKGLAIPIVYNTNGYDLVDTLKLLEGIVDIYMPDIKFADDLTAEAYLKVKQYYSIAKKAVKEMYRQVGDLKVNEEAIAYQGLLIRHLVMPQNLAGTEKIMQFIADDLSPDTYVNIMAQYYPAYKAHKYETINRRITKEEFQSAINAAKSTGLTNIR
ncbi:radical SAM protein [Clostridium formicaceticum]|uniref:Radical SAM protein n=1 Tax=Clostridium formicaceticum TaxID=1497 RepID=A0AAC9RML7_9CLOT|nr:radical SAM protein [Clostridium formicaceticum]AOY77776.1 radical SAM protein [Clostridium formicaceticum]ARE88382.1 Radical SAM superfamily protein [Clostridium formicaceticum]